jgi:hypothetical protein
MSLPDILFCVGVATGVLWITFQLGKIRGMSQMEKLVQQELQDMLGELT